MLDTLKNNVIDLFGTNGFSCEHIADIGGRLCSDADPRLFAVDPDADDLAEILQNADAVCFGALDLVFDAEKTLKRVLSCKPAQVPVAVCALNFSNIQIVMSLLEGSFPGISALPDGLPRKQMYSPSALYALTERCGLLEIARADISATPNVAADRYALAANGTDTNGYLRWLGKNLNDASDTLYFVRLYRSAASDETAAPRKESTHPFLSVLTRTQGHRREALTETILSLSAQSCTDFELMIVAHNVHGEQETLVRNIIASQPAWMREKIRYIPVDGGTRTTPINVGFAAAHGEYVSVLDDDDIVFDDWVESFKDAAERRPGTLLHAYTLAQNWSTIPSRDGVDTLRASGEMQTQFCTDFDMLHELVQNECPPCGLAFPRHAFARYGVRFDETLNTTEDWDYIMRVAFLCGVTDIRHPTALYRLWINAENSHTVHDEAEWRRNYLYIQDKLAKMPLLLSADECAHYIARARAAALAPVGERHCVVAFDCGRHFNAADTLDVQECADADFDYECPAVGDVADVQRLRFDLVSAKLVTLRDFKARVIYADGSTQDFGIDDVSVNVKKRFGKYLFFAHDPQLTLKDSMHGKIVDVHFSLRVHDFGAKLKKTLPYRALRRLIRTIHR